MGQCMCPLLLIVTHTLDPPLLLLLLPQASSLRASLDAASSDGAGLASEVSRLQAALEAARAAVSVAQVRRMRACPPLTPRWQEVAGTRSPLPSQAEAAATAASLKASEAGRVQLEDELRAAAADAADARAAHTTALQHVRKGAGLQRPQRFRPVQLFPPMPCAGCADGGCHVRCAAKGALLLPASSPCLSRATCPAHCCCYCCAGPRRGARCRALLARRCPGRGDGQA